MSEEEVKRLVFKAIKFTLENGDKPMPANMSLDEWYEYVYNEVKKYA